MSAQPIPRTVFTDAYRGFLVLETEMVELYAEAQEQLGIRCSATSDPVAANVE